MNTPPLARRLLAELLGSAFLAALVIGSGIAAQTLSPGDVGLELFENAAATAAGLYTIILMFGPISGGHFNPVVSLADASFGGIRRRDVLAYIPAQVAGCVLGAVIANGMFSLAAISISTHHRATLSRAIEKCRLIAIEKCRSWLSGDHRISPVLRTQTPHLVERATSAVLGGGSVAASAARG